MLGLKEHRSFQAADDAWSAELRRLFGKQAGDVRYTARGKGEVGSVLLKTPDIATSKAGIV